MHLIIIYAYEIELYLIKEEYVQESLIFNFLNSLYQK